MRKADVSPFDTLPRAQPLTPSPSRVRFERRAKAYADALACVERVRTAAGSAPTGRLAELVALVEEAKERVRLSKASDLAVHSAADVAEQELATCEELASEAETLAKKKSAKRKGVTS